ncbi:uncharacterized protein LOC121775293 isoform X2 [Salvia splendens]|uniref:uncharacterized protein LOC121775293 isoform X2 n=1 Tax=Salvia splendens TaxID=180675 RepID=UPI001C267918|nr:uncharacterized protein LOC121775293 isoform X2 [Salvia splendens]
MFNAVRLQASNPVALRSSSSGNGGIVSSPSRLSLRLPAPRRFASFTLLSVDNATSEPSAASQLTSTVGSQPQLTLSHRHIQFLSLTACAAFKRAAESLEKLMDATREELPDTMAAVRLSGMEISDLTMELSDLGQELTQGVRSSTRTVRMAEERWRRLTNMKPIVSVQEVAPMRAQIGEPVLARTARRMREGIVKGRGVVQMLFTLTRYSKMLLNYFTSRSKA